MITELDLILRAVASRTRLRILASILRAPDAPVPQGRGIRPAVMARLLNLSPSAVSQHLRVLLRLHLVRYWKRSGLKFYRLARLKPGSFRSRLVDRIARNLPDRLPPVFSESPQDAAKRGGRRPKPAKLGAAAVPSLQPVWTELTCYSHFRRILMLQYLQRHGHATLGALATAADIHPRTAAYHVDKLLRRSELVLSEDGFTLARPKHNAIRGLVHEVAASAPAPPHA